MLVPVGVNLTLLRLPEDDFGRPGRVHFALNGVALCRPRLFNGHSPRQAGWLDWSLAPCLACAAKLDPRMKQLDPVPMMFSEVIVALETKPDLDQQEAG
jgi:hypothetical protein